MSKILGFGRSEKFVLGAGGTVTSFEEILKNTNTPVAWSGVGYHPILRILEKCSLDYYYIDTGYFGNGKRKTYKRITKNNLNDSRDLIQRPSDRLLAINLDKTQYKRGEKILIIPPDQKVLTCWAPTISADKWTAETLEILKKHTDREVEVRTRVKSRTDRVATNKFTDALQNNIYATVVWSSNCAVESVIHGIPTVSLGPSATKKVSPFSIEQIDNIPNLDKDLVDSWLKHLSYSQFTDEEMLNGTAWKILNQ
jgi:hypothetical protein